MKIKKTIKQVLLFVKVGQLYIESVKGKENKLSEAIKVVQKRIAKDEIIESYYEELNDNKLLHCMVDPKNESILRTPAGELMFTREGQKELNELNKNSLKKTVELMDCIFPESAVIAKKLTDFEIQVFSGFVIKEAK